MAEQSRDTRADFISEVARENHLEIFDSTKGAKVLGPFNGPYDVCKHAVDEDQPVIALYDRSLVEGADFMAQAAARLRAKGEQIANFVVVPHGMYAEKIVAGEAGNSLFVEAGYTKDAKGATYVFDQPNKPLPVTMVDISNLYDPTMERLVEAKIPAVRSKRQLEFDDKWLAKQRLQEFGVPTPNGSLHAIDELRAGEVDLSPQFVLKPRISLGGMHVYLFKDGMEPERFATALEEAGQYYDDLLVEEYLESLTIKHSSIEGPAAFNLRVITYNGYCGAFARIHPEGLPGNVYTGASTLSLPKLKQILRHQHQIDTVKLQDSIEAAAYQVSAAFPNAFIGFDAMINEQGDVPIIEVNMNDFGAFDPNAFSKKDWATSLERAARKISAVARTYEKVDLTSLDPETAYGIVDRPERLLHVLRHHFMERRYYTDDKEFNSKKFWRNNRKLIIDIYEAFEARRLAGDAQHCQSVFEDLQNLAKEVGHKTLTRNVTASLAQIAIYKQPPPEAAT